MKDIDYDLFHTDPGTPAGRYMRLFWHPLYRGQDLPAGRAIPVRLLGENFTLYRGESGKARVISFRCAHRGAQLSLGWVEGDCIRCLYHGWKYDEDGQCIEQPGEDEAFAAKVSIKTYPSEEYLGLVFVYIGDDPTPPLRRFPDFEKPGVLETDPPEPWPCNVVNRLENDPAHVPWTHRESTLRTGQHQRHMEGREAERYGRRYVETDYGMATAGGNRNLLPNINALRVPVKTIGWEKLWEYRLIFHVPVDDQNSVAFDVNLVPGLEGDEAERFRRRRREIQEAEDPEIYHMAKAILAGKKTVRDVPADLSLYKQFWIEDYVTQVGLGAVLDREQEHLGRNDQKIILRRKILKREITALAEGRSLKNWTSSNLYEPVQVD